MNKNSKIEVKSKKLGVLVGGSGLIGGGLTHHYKSDLSDETIILAPNSKKLSLKSEADTRQYFNDIKPNFIINTAIATIDSDPELAYKINYLGAINLAKIAAAKKIPYIYFGTAATLPSGQDIKEDSQLPITANMHNYAKSKLMVDHTLREMHQKQGLDFTTIRLAIVYGTHDRKMQGITHLFYAMAKQVMPFLLTSPTVVHSYSNALKVPYLVDHVLNNRQEFSNQIVHLVDPQPVKLGELILAVKKYLGTSRPHKLFIPYTAARFAKTFMKILLNVLTNLGVETKMPAEMMFLERFYQSQTLSAEKLNSSSFSDPFPEKTIFSELTTIMDYYVKRWEQLNLINPKNPSEENNNVPVNQFIENPDKLLEDIHQSKVEPFIDLED